MGGANGGSMEGRAKRGWVIDADEKRVMKMVMKERKEVSRRGETDWRTKAKR